MDLHAGGKIDAISTLSEKEKKNLTDYIVKTLKKYDGVSELSPEISETELNTWKDRFEKEGLSMHIVMMFCIWELIIYVILRRILLKTY